MFFTDCFGEGKKNSGKKKTGPNKKLPRIIIKYGGERILEIVENKKNRKKKQNRTHDR